MTASRDPSSRHVLAEDAPYLNNLAALWAVDPELAAGIEAIDPRPGYRIEPSKAGPPTLAVTADSGRTLYLHSRYDPIEEARRMIDRIDVDQRMVYLLHGLGLGYHVELLFKRAGGEAIFCIFEPDLHLLRIVFEHRDLAPLIESRRVMFFTRADKSDLFLRLTPHTALLSLGIERVLHSPSVQLAGEFHRQMQAWTEQFATYCRTHLNTLVLNGRRTAGNIARNLGWYAATAGIERHRDRYRGQPAVIVSAGPSLRKNMHLLEKIAGKAVIIAVQTTLRPLLEMGIEPQFVTSLDCHDTCTRFFEKLPKHLHTELIAEPKAADAIFGLHPGPLTVLGNAFAENLLADMRLNKGRLPAGATAAHLAYHLAEHLGCDPIIFIGQDLGFSDGLCYAPGTSYEDVWRPELSRFCTVEMKQWEQIARDRAILRKIPDQQGRPMYTDQRLFSYLQQFERDFARSDRRIIDATEGGAMKRGAAVMTLAEAISLYCTNDLPVAVEDHPPLRWERVEECRACLRRRREEAGEIERISRDTLSALEEVRDHLRDQGRVNRAIARVDALRARMEKLNLCYGLIMQLAQPQHIRRMPQRRPGTQRTVHDACTPLCGLSVLSGNLPKLQQRQVMRDIDTVRGVVDAADEFQRLMEKVIGHLGGDSAAARGEAA